MGAFEERGIIELGVVSQPEVTAMNHYFDYRAEYNGHVRRGNSFDMAHGSDATCYSLEDMVLAPFLLSIGLQYSPLAQKYLGQKCYMYSINVFNTYPSANPPIGYIQEFHRDHDDDKFLALFIYLTDVFILGDGAHEYLVGTHKEGVNMGELLTIFGGAGTMFIEDGKGLHRGLKPRHHRRIAWIRWCISNPPRTYVQDSISPVPKELVTDYDLFTENEKDMIQLIVR